MLKKYTILFGIIISIILLFIATTYYPGGSQYNKNSVGYDWGNNYLSNLFGNKALNGLDNLARPWAIGGVLFLNLSFALFFIEFSKKIPSKRSSRIIRYFGVGAMIFGFLTVTPYHDLMVTLSGTLVLVSMFYITIFVFLSKLHLFKVFSVVCLLVFYCCNYMYYTRSYLEFLPIMQKVSLGITIIWALALQYFTTKADFEGKRKLLH